MIAELVIGFIVGIVIAVPVWIVAQHLGAGRGFPAPRARAAGMTGSGVDATPASTAAGVACC
ncbi:hypothetical protein ACU7M0_37465, partial [Burkholderia cenocepacia]